jgi:hypothetical protein
VIANSPSHGRYMIHVRGRHLSNDEILGSSVTKKRGYTMVVIVPARDKVVNTQRLET